MKKQKKYRGRDTGNGRLTWLGSPSLLPSLDALGEGVVDGEHAAEELGAVHVVHGSGGVLALKEGDEAEGAVLLRGLVQRRLDVLDLAEGHERGVQDLLVHLLRQPTCAHQSRSRKLGLVHAHGEFRPSTTHDRGSTRSCRGHSEYS